MEKFEVGQTIENFKYHDEGMQFDVADDGAHLLVFFKSPTREEIDQFRSGKNFEIRFMELYGVIMITVKLGNLNWMDAPYSPHLSKKLSKFTFPNDNQGLGLMLYLVDAITGKIEHLRLLGLSEQFTKKLLGTVLEEKMKDFDILNYKDKLTKIYSTYTTKQIVKMSKDYFKIN